MEIVHRKCGYLNGIDVSADGCREGLYLAWNGNDLVSVSSFFKKSY